ncbi:MAG: ornithine carbamoyltransferase [Spirochaetaceae bacterium]
MSVNLKHQSFLTLADFEPQAIRYLIDLAHAVKKESRTGVTKRRFEGMSLALLFEKRSTRTRCAFETAFGEEGGHPVFLSQTDIHLGVKETIEDTARVLGRMFDAIQFRGYKQETVQLFAEHSNRPVYNGLTDLYHPTQILADLQTLQENAGEPAGRTLSFVGDGRNNVARSLMIGCSKVGVNIRVGSPASLQPDAESVEVARSFAAESGAQVLVTDDPGEAVSGADAVYTDVWVSMGEEEQSEQRLRQLSPYRVNTELLERTGNPEVVFLHCLPAVRGNEVTSEVMDGPHSRVFDQSENRKHTIKALMLATLLDPADLPAV